MNEENSEGVRELSERFAAEYGRDPDVVWAAPGRVNLIGEHTDYSDGFVLPLALPQCAYVAAGRRKDDRVNVYADGFGKVALPVKELMPGAVSGWVAYVAGPLWALGQEGVELGGLDIALSSDVPIGAGLSSSAAVECSTICAAADLLGANLGEKRLACLAQRAEVEVVGMPCGIMDQMVSVCARAGHALFLDCRSLETQHIPLALQEHDLTLLVIDTRAPHRLVDGAYAERRAACEQAAAILGVPALRDATLEQVMARAEALGPERFKRARHVVTENARVEQAVRCLTEGQPRELGPLLRASHLSLRDDFEVSVPELDVAVDTATIAGALGARLIGGGFGGCVLVLAPAACGELIEKSVTDAFALRGFHAPAVFRAVASQGAHPVA